MGEIYERYFRDWAKAEEYYLDCTKKDPERADAWFYIGMPSSLSLSLYIYIYIYPFFFSAHNFGVLCTVVSFRSTLSVERED